MTANTERLSAALAGRYRIERHLGEGGMATVYLAEDLKHDRKVALKVLKPELAAVLGAERFVQEIKTTAALQHPHILPLFDSSTADGFLFYVMPYIQGETLRAKLDRETQLGVDEAVRIAREVADALDYAHRHGVIHRDIKPENILLHDGRPMVADFGIALAVSAAAGGRMTETGLSLGTPHYMSPEQATAEKEITARSDIYSLGSVLFEMLSGQPPHLGGSAQQIIMRIITEAPRPVTEIRKSVPPHVAAAVAKALEKLPADRFESAKAFADALGNPGYTNAAFTHEATGDNRGARRVFTRPFVAMAMLAAVALAGWGWSAMASRRANRANNDRVVRLTLTMPEGQRFSDVAISTRLAISPQGDRIVYLTSGRGFEVQSMWSRQVDQLESKLVVAGKSMRGICISPDGRWVGYIEGGDVKKISVDGGPVVTLASLPPLLAAGMTWGTSGFLAVGGASLGLFVIPERGGEARLLPKMADELSNNWPLFLPDGKTIVYANPGGAGQLTLASVADGKRTLLDVPGAAPLAFLNGQLVYSTLAGTLMAVPFDGHRVGDTDPVPLVQDVVMAPLGTTLAAVSATGTLVYRSGKVESQAVLVRGGETPLSIGRRMYFSPRFSPDGKRAAFAVANGQVSDVWVYDRARAILTKVTSEGSNERPEWSPDGKRLIFLSNRGGQNAFWWQPADGSAPAELLYKPTENDPLEAILSSDRRWLVYRTGPAGNPPTTIYAIALDGDRKSIPIVTAGGRGVLMQPRLSPDGHWLAYQSSESGPMEVYVRPFPEGAGKQQVSAGGGSEPLWAESGQALYYRKGSDIIRVSVTKGASLGLGDQKVVMSGDYLTSMSHQNYDVSPDGSEFLMLRSSGDDVQTIVVHNWVRELSAKTAARGAR